ncbi:MULTISPECIES: endonuclease III domain-containing protein [Methanobacterium]|jgi:endonuclease-3 related protein|uniref:Endonuclease III domain-containing protein n=1 Tax=Methanobacterium veterum TaxID=408577 RepID=A0A9E5A694_9EURY|nr:MULTISPECIES: endonuclease III domain-containing protein [Methanobacterium]MCZ3367002.1 endonuclease III domain-containing protein [Methanobacterium veterum]MCZ3373851.1 endonuclease III domain-containing protein [Methanobacterium veterum]
MQEKIIEIYGKLYDLYGPQGWWPLINHDGINPTKTGAIRGYHPENYELPTKRDQVYEIIIGAILTQNTSWLSAEMALFNLDELDVISPEKLLKLDDETLKSAIRCAGFLNQKAIYIREVTKFFIGIEGKVPTRKELLAVKGIGNETADSILLYAYKQPQFVVDAYTKRIFSHLGIVSEDIKYMELKELFESNLPEDMPLYQEYHALIVEHAKRYYSKKPYGVNDPLKDLMKY